MTDYQWSVLRRFMLVCIELLLMQDKLSRKNWDVALELRSELESHKGVSK